MMHWFRRLLPHQEMFFPLFEQHSRAVLASAEALRQMLEGAGETDGRWQEKIGEAEHTADEITRDVLLGIRTSFITPFDRSDIKNLITSMDDAIDQVQHTAKAIVLFEVRVFEPEMRAMADAIVECAELLARAVPLISDLSANAALLNEICVQISSVEGRADEIHDCGLRALYQQAKAGDALEFIRLSQIYEHLEECVDRFDDVANEIQGIVIEHV